MQLSTGIIFLLAALLVNSVNGLSREQIIEATIQEVISEEQNAHIQNSGSQEISGSSELLRAFKGAPEEAIRQGKARIMFEKVISRAEKNILEEQTKSASTPAEAESITEMGAQNAGSILSQAEISSIYNTGQHKCKQPIINCHTAESRERRTVTGVCNNLQHNLLWGSAGTQFGRILAPQYEDNFSRPRGASQSQGYYAFGPPYPSPRKVSLEIFHHKWNSKHNDFSDYTHMMMQWGQFVDHDIDITPITGAHCHDCEVNEECLPIRIPPDDTKKFDSSKPAHPQCMQFTRSAPFCDPFASNGVLTPRQQVNKQTSFIDASQVYGSNENLFNSLRDKTTGLLITGPRIPAHGKASLPINPNTNRCRGPCFLAGDGRVNEQTALTIMHTIWMREHNRIATVLKQRNPGIDAEEVFQTARAIVGAVIQKITFKEFLPTLLGNAMNLIKPYTGYKSWVDPSISNAFATAAYRFGHSQVYHLFQRFDENYSAMSNLLLKDAFFNFKQFELSGGTDPILRGLMLENSRKVDEFLKLVLTDHLFETPGSNDGLDLAALNIQRGRDHGLPPYLSWKTWAELKCGWKSSFANIDTENRLKQLYGHSLDTVDLWVGGLAETHVGGGGLGATFACIVADTFERLRDGDRFYYENPGGLFNAQQIASIEKTSLSRVICDNGDNIQWGRQNLFSVYSPWTQCIHVGGLDLSLWDVNRPYGAAASVE